MLDREALKNRDKISGRWRFVDSPERSGCICVQRGSQAIDHAGSVHAYRVTLKDLGFQLAIRASFGLNEDLLALSLANPGAAIWIHRQILSTTARGRLRGRLFLAHLATRFLVGFGLATIRCAAGIRRPACGEVILDRPVWATADVIGRRSEQHRRCRRPHQTNQG